MTPPLEQEKAHPRDETITGLQLDDAYRPPETSPWADRPAIAQAPDLLWRWEKLRVAYNAVLLAESLFFLAVYSAMGMIRNPGTLILIALAVSGLGANVCFCAGPVVDGYCHRFGFGSRWTSLVIFVLGTLLSMALTLGMIDTICMSRD